MDRPPPPSLQALVEEAGDWSRITPQAWAEFYVAMDRWKMAVRWGDVYVRDRPWGFIDQKAKAKSSKFKPWPYS